MQKTDHDDRFNVALHFETQPTNGATPDLPANPFFPVDGAPQNPNFLKDYKDGHYAFQRFVNAKSDLGANIYDRFNTFAALWTEDSVTYYFGPDPSHLRQIYKTPTPPGAQSPMYVIANDQFTTQGHWWEPDPRVLNRVVSPQNGFQIRNIRVRALLPPIHIGPDQADPGNSVLVGTEQDDWLEPGRGFDVIELNGGADTIYLTRGPHSKIIAGFGPDDRLILTGYPFINSADALARLTQVGADVWLPSGADPAHPHTLIFRDTIVGAFLETQLQIIWPLARNNFTAGAGQHIKYQGDGKPVLAEPFGSKLNDTGLKATLVGGPGNDHFYVAHPATILTKGIGGGGIDSLTTYKNYVLPLHVQNGIAAAAGVTLVGNAGNNRLRAAAANVTLNGADGDDLFEIDPSASAIIRITKGTGHDRLIGLKPQDRIDIARLLRVDLPLWRMTSRANGVLLSFNPNQSLFIQGDPNQLANRLALQLGIEITK